jgi:hypothetical protein
MAYRTLDPARILETATVLQRRIGERFPQSSLLGVSSEVTALASESIADAEKLEEPIWWLRLVIGGVTLFGALIFVFIGTLFSFDRISAEVFAIERIEAGINTAVLGGIGMITLVRLEERIKQKQVLKGLHQLRSIIHVIDMHQLTKDPVALDPEFKPTASSPARTMSESDLKRYLDYCSELLSLTGKLAALYAQAVNDSVVVEAVNDVENLGTNLSRKIWQKIMLIGELSQRTIPRSKRKSG